MQEILLQFLNMFSVGPWEKNVIYLRELLESENDS